MLWYRPMEYKVMPLTELVWSETFKTLEGWNQKDLVESSDHRTHSNFLDPVTGQVDMNQPWNKVPMRHAALYDEYRDKCQFIENGSLVMKGYAVETKARFRDSFVDAEDPNLIHRYGDFEIYGGWVSSKRRFSPGCVIEADFNVEAQCMRGHRLSIWLVATKGPMYGTSVKFCEIDLLEVEFSPEGKDFGNHGLQKIVGGKAGDTPGGQVDFGREDLQIDIHKGEHTARLEWYPNGSLKFFMDGKLCVTDDRTKNFPPDGVTMEDAQLIISTEMASGVVDADGHAWQNRSTGPRMPKDEGLFGESVVRDIGKIDKHRVYVREIREFRMREGKVEGPIDPSVSAEELARIIEDYEQRLRELRQMVNELTLEVEGVTQRLNTLLQAIQVLRDA